MSDLGRLSQTSNLQVRGELSQLLEKTVSDKLLVAFHDSLRLIANTATLFPAVEAKCTSVMSNASTAYTKIVWVETDKLVRLLFATRHGATVLNTRAGYGIDIPGGGHIKVDLHPAKTTHLWLVNMTPSTTATVRLAAFRVSNTG